MGNYTLTIEKNTFNLIVNEDQHLFDRSFSVKIEDANGNTIVQHMSRFDTYEQCVIWFHEKDWFYVFVKKI